MKKKLLAFILVLVLALPVGAQASDLGYMRQTASNYDSVTFKIDTAMLGGNIQSIKISVNGTLNQDLTSPGTDTFTISGLSPSTTYTVDVDMVKAGGYGTHVYDEDTYTTDAVLTGTNEATEPTPPAPQEFDYTTGSLVGDTPNNHTATADADGYKRTSGWDYVGAFDWNTTLGTGNQLTQSGNIKYIESTGGSFRIDVTNHAFHHYLYSSSSPSLLVQLYEYDPVGGDDYVGYWRIPASSTVTHLDISNADAYKDGVNGRAEFYIKTSTNYATTITPLVFNFYD
jgi:hypothetical protein